MLFAIDNLDFAKVQSSFSQHLNYKKNYDNLLAVFFNHKRFEKCSKHFFGGLIWISKWWIDLDFQNKKSMQSLKSLFYNNNNLQYFNVHIHNSTFCENERIIRINKKV